MRTTKDLLHVKTESALRALATREAGTLGLAVLEDATPVTAVVNHGRWIAVCPTCGGGVSTHPGWPALCLTCDDGVGTPVVRLLTTVAWPAPSLRAALEKTLRRRPRAASRNWAPGESAEDLRRENRQHQLPEE